MRQNPSFALGDTDEIKRLIRENPWATIVSQTALGPVASHYPVLLDESREDISIVSHLGKPDDLIHEFGSHELLVIIQGPHGYISPGWYDANPAVPTWNFVVAHLSGVPEILSDEENWNVLGRLVDHFEDRMPQPRRMAGTPDNEAYAQRLLSGTVGWRLTPTRTVAKSKLSQNRPVETVDRIIDGLEGDGAYASPALAAEMRRVHERIRAAKDSSATR
ncbi:FMN-binding negative transcriptional regulator [Leifsonia sp. Root112D2]|uniref:FMN-binding negative transcriptional regulator n=1 Tax=Leifsonia sp. Root112D2 TaxID=1736426 RepID=UPI0007009F3A|nr:FMN-binding negative transcriptional regulator [Leifsonia sp. Root112D2]KQV07792.1 transcriptional regulator [Leifsonia sp. Root112D2]